MNSGFRKPRDIVDEALTYKPRAVYVGFSGGDDSLCTAHWMMNNVPQCQVFHANTGIGVEKTREFVRATCKKHGWPLHELRAKEDCGQDYDQLVIERGFPGPAMHRKMYSRLKERCVEKLVRESKKNWKDKILIATGLRHDESARRAGYAGREINFKGAQMWVNPMYWVSKSLMMNYIKFHGLQRNPVSELLGMSGECLCGAYAHAGEKALVRIVDPATADRIEALEVKVRAAGYSWGWEEKPPSRRAPKAFFGPFCVGCEKHD